MGFGVKLGVTAMMVAGMLLAAPSALAQPHGGFGGGPRGFARPGFMRPPLGARGPGLRPGGMPGPFMRRFSAANSTHDGHLTLDQARAANMNVLARHFNEIDASHKGYVTLDDIRAFRAKVRARREAAQGDDAFGPPAGAPPP